VSTISSVELGELARKLAGDRFDDYAAGSLARAYDEYVGRRRRAIAPVSIRMNGTEYPSIYALLADREAEFTGGELRLATPPTSPEAEFLTPVERVVFAADGSAEVHPPGGGAPQRAIARLLLREHYVVRPKGDDAPGASRSGFRLPSRFGTLAEGIATCRSGPVIPFEVAFLLYLGEERARLEVDAVHMTLLADPRAGRLAASRRVSRPSRLAWGLDRKIGRGHLSLLAARCLEVLVESNGLTAIDLVHVFGGVRELVDSALQALVQQRYVTFDGRTGIYRARLDGFLPRTEAPREAVAPVRPELRTSVQELIAAADARSACPLCGKPLPADRTTLLCDDCAAKVGLG